MSEQGQQPQWQYNQKYGYYVYSRTTDRVTFPEPRGTVQRPPDMHPAGLIAIEDTNAYTGSPPDARSGYMTQFDQHQSNQQDIPRRGPNPTFSMNSSVSAVNSLSANMANMTVAGPSRAPTQVPRGAHPVPPHYFERKGMKFLETGNPTNGVRTLVVTTPPQGLIDPQLQDQGIVPHQVMLGVDGEHETLFTSYRKRKASFFVIGRVFMVLWAEPAGASSNTMVTSLVPGTHVGRYGEQVYSKVRRFVVVREAETYCSALPITTYGGRGVSKQNVKKSEHTIIFTGKHAPSPLLAELPGRGENPMRPGFIRVDQDSLNEKLDPISRLDFGKVYTVQHNIKVKSFGLVNKAYVAQLMYQFEAVWRRDGDAGPSQAPPIDPRFAEWKRYLVANGKTPEQAQHLIDRKRQEAIDQLLATAAFEAKDERETVMAGKKRATKVQGQEDESDEEDENEDEDEDDEETEEGGEDDEEGDEDDGEEDDDDEDDEDDEQDDEDSSEDE